MMITHQIFKDNGQHQDGVEGQLQVGAAVTQRLQEVAQEPPERLRVIVCDEVGLPPHGGSAGQGISGLQAQRCIRLSK